MEAASDLRAIYATRFANADSYRQKIWLVLAGFFSRWISGDSAVLDLGCGHCEFINAIHAKRKLGMDLNPDATSYAGADVKIIQADCSKPWPIEERLDAVFTSNFFEHLPTKSALIDTLRQAQSALRPGGLLICMGPNIKYTSREYWDFIDHYLPLSHVSLEEGLRLAGFEIQTTIPRFLPYTMSGKRESPIWMVRLYLSLPLAWRLFGKQFLIVAQKPAK